MSNRHSLIIVTGPEGSGTSYAFDALRKANEMPARRRWLPGVFDGVNKVPQRGIHHVSLPCFRPGRWLSEIRLPNHAKIVILVRDRKYAVRSAYRRFKNETMRGSAFEELNYQRALQEIEMLKKKHDTIVIRYEDLGQREVRAKIEEFCGLPASWGEFENADVCDLRLAHNAGFFSCCSVRLHRIVRMVNNLSFIPMIIDSSKMFGRYKANKVEDITYCFFKEPLAEVDLFVSGRKIGFSTRFTFRNYHNLDHNRLGPFVKKYFSPSELINRRKKSLIKKYAIDFKLNDYCAVYYRGTDKRNEITLPRYNVYLKKMRKIRNKNPNVRFILQTDEPKFIKHARRTGIPFVSFEENYLSRTGAGVHHELKGQEAFDHAVAHFSILLILSQCQHLVCGHSNGSLWMNLYRGHNRNLHVRRRRNGGWEELKWD